ncbi:hypothetical protein A8C75_21960 [Marinobacterium aestuarii]|uniref:PIN domain-containing protein n=1 Tax=Marinobacterium aestuarii TaxID=1821621 RepID=A0A1A9F481_9GAMM|nr:hypothetical protein [Marinobacterium aestuarii]ANG64882.1 hypothetical protein A8C75_21960 [Marinobacterium aestuarii]
MHTVQFEITKPTDESAFEDMCANIYGDVYDDKTPTLNGRRGQAQAGIDVFVDSAQGRIGIQCKRYVDGALKLKHVVTEIERADKANVPIAKLIVATTAESDVKLIREVQDLSDQRVKASGFPVIVQFWNDLCRYIRKSGELQRDYAPNAPGAMFSRQEESSVALMVQMKSMQSLLDVVSGLPGSRPEAVGSYLSNQLDAVNERLKQCQFRDALDDINRLASTFEVFDDHQKARWYVQRGICTWQLGDDASASADFLKGAELYPDDEKMAAAGIRGQLLRGDIPTAIEAGERALESFPASAHVWLAYANAKMLTGKHLGITDAPVAIRDNCDVLQLVAISRQQAGDLDGAIALIRRALENPDAGFFVRRVALALTLEAATTDPIRCHYGLLPADQISALDQAVAQLTPRQERLWPVQIPEGREDAAAHLGFAYIVLNRPGDTLDLFDEARSADMLSPRLKRVALEAYRCLNRIDELLRDGRDWLASLDKESLFLVAEAAAHSGDIDLMNAVAKTVAGLPFLDYETESLIVALKWDALWWSRDGREQAILEVKQANVSTSDSLPLVCGAAQILHRAGEEAECDATVSHAIELLDDGSPGPDVLHVAELLYMVGRYREASQYYERFADKGQRSFLHARLLACFVKSGERRRALELVRSLPGDWAADDQLRSLALELGQIAADFELLDPLAEVQCERSPNVAGGWLLRLSLDLKTKKLHRFHLTLAGLPEALEGTHTQITQIAALEIKYGLPLSGMKRLYRLFRQHLDELEAATCYFMGIVMAPADLTDMEEVLPSVTEGTAVRLEPEYGDIITVAIDPQNTAPLPARDSFYSAESPEVDWLLGAEVGDVIEHPGPFGTYRKYRVQAITSVYRYLLQVAEGKFRTSLTSDAVIASVPIARTKQGTDFSHMHAMLKRQTEHINTVFRSYGEGPLTLGILSLLLNRNVVDIVNGWSSDDVPLFVCSGTIDGRQAAITLLEREDASYVVDAATLAELVWLRCQRALAVLPKVYCSNQTLALLESKLEEAQSERSSGQVYDAGDSMQYIEFTEKDRERRIDYCRNIVATVHEYCEVVPAYGPQTLPPKLHNFDSVLAEEEYSAVLLAAERDATLLTVDGRLAQMVVEILEIYTVWPQVLLYQAAKQDSIMARAYHIASVQEFVANRDFISLGAYDLLLMCSQGGAFLRKGLQRFKNFLANPNTELQGAATILFEFLELQAGHRTQLKAFLELLSHVVEATLRHPRCNAQELRLRADSFADDIASIQAGPDFPCPIMSRTRRVRYETIRKLLLDTIDSAFTLATQPPRRRAIKLKVLMGTTPPSLIFDGDVPEPVDDTMDTHSAPLTPDNQTITGEDSVTSAAAAYLIDQ